MSRLAWGGEEENAFLFAVLGVIGGVDDDDHDHDHDHVVDDHDHDHDHDHDDGLFLFAVLGLWRLRALVLAALPAEAPGAPRPVAAPAVDHILR